MKEEKAMSRCIEIIIKPTKRCNLNCKYCYVPDEAKSTRIMNVNIATEIIKKVADYTRRDGKVNFIWHGAEPMSIGLDFYRRVICLQKELLSPTQYTNGIQSNGTLINEEAVSFFKENNFAIGISLDGPGFIHNENRIFAMFIPVVDSRERRNCYLEI